MNIKRRTVLKGIAGAVVASTVPLTTIPVLQDGGVIEATMRGSIGSGLPRIMDSFLLFEHDSNRVWAEFTLPPGNIPIVGTSMKINIPVLDEIFEGTVTSISANSDGDTVVRVLEKIKRDDI